MSVERRPPFARVGHALLCAWLVSSTDTAAQTNGTSALTQLQFDIVGVRLVVDPPVLTVPKQIATQINTSLVLPTGASLNTSDAVAALTQGALVEGTLRGPSIPPTRITARPGQPLPLPAFALPGDYFLDGIRLVKDGVPLLDATAQDGRPATTIPIAVINEIFVTSVTSRPLSLDEIKEKGIVIDANNFQAVNFQVAFNIDGAPFTIQLPAALPTRELLNTKPTRELLIQQLSVVNQQLAATRTSLPPEFDRPGLNFSIAALPFFPVLEDADDPGFDIPPVTGIVLIPGNVAFLNQFFSVVLMVSNVAPDGTPLVLRDVTGTIKLPTGLDRVAGASYENPGDDPLRLARIEGIGQQVTVRVVQLGPDEQIGTADDVASIPPQKGGEGEFLLEGLKEGGHIFDIEIDAVLDGLPSGPVSLVGAAAGAVFVRNPTFSVTLAHPRTIRSGEPYDIYATVTNTSRSVANLVSVNLDPLGISGAQLISEPSVSFETIPAGQAVTAKFRLIAQQTGEITASSFTGEADGGIRLFTGVGERGVPLAPNAIVLPSTTDALPSSLVAAAQRVLGQAFSIATAPAEALPPDVLFVKRQTVIDHALELAEAGQRIQFGDSLPRVVQDLLLDWLGARTFDPGFDQLMRTTDAGRAFLDEIGKVLAPSFAGNALGAQRAFVEQALARAAPLTAVVRGPADRAPVQLRILRNDGAVLGGGSSTLTRAGLLQMTDPAALTSLATAVAPDPLQYVIEAVSPAGGVVDLGVTTPALDPTRSVLMNFAGIALDPGGLVRVLVDLTVPGPVSAQVDRNGDGVVDETLAGVIDTLVEEPLGIVDVVQLQSSFYAAPGDIRDPATYGLLVGVLFNKPTRENSAEDKSNYVVDANKVVGVAQQTGGRLTYLYLERPIGGLVPRSLTTRNVVDVHGNVLSETTRPIRMVLTDGARVFGQVREANGSGVPTSFLSVVIGLGPAFSFNVSAILTDAQGSFDFDFIPRLGTLSLTAQHPQTRALASVQARIRGAGESLLLNPTFLGAGSVRGRVLAADGVTPVPRATVALFPGSVFSSRGLQTTANDLGEFTLSDVPVGVFTLRAIDGRQASGQGTGVLESAGNQAIVDIVVVDEPSDGGTLVGRVFLSDGVTPANGFRVLVGQYDRQKATIAAVDQTQTDATGSFAFSRSMPAGGYDVVAVDEATGQVGSTRTTVIALTTTAVSIVMDATGAVQGVVFNAGGQPVAGALVAGGLTLVETDANGAFRIDGVPAGKRTIEAGDPVTRRRGSAEVNVLPGQTVVAAITLEARATITGRVLDANGTPVPRASVRIPSLGGFTFVIANNQGVFTFPDMTLGDYLIQSPGPTAEALIEFLESNGYDPNVAFTSGDGPGVPPAPPSSSDASAVIAAYQNAVQTFLSVDESILGLPDADLGGFGWNKVRLFQDSVTQVADIRFLQQGTVAGRTVDSAGRPTGALVRVSALKVSNTGSPSFGELKRLNSDAATGEFSFGGIARFDLATFQTAGVRAGDYTLEAAQQFSPVIVQFRDQLNTANPTRTDVVLQFPAATETNGTASGIVVMPDGVTPAPAGTVVRISFGDLTVTTNAEGKFVSLLPIPAGAYTFTAQTPTGGLRGQASAQVPAGGDVSVTVRLLGLGSVLVQARRPNGQAVTNATVRVTRGTFPSDQADGVTDAAGFRRFVNLTEGPFSVEVEEAITGLTGRASGLIVRDTEVSSVVTITASGSVTGTFLSADGSQPIPFSQITLSGGGVQAYATTDASGRFELTAIPVGAFTIDARDPATGRAGRAQSQLSFEGQTVDVTVIQLPRGTVAGYVLNADGVTGIAAANVELTTSSFIPTRLQVSTRADGSFRIAGVPAGDFSLTARDPVSGAAGTANGTLAFEGETVDRNVVLQPFGAIRVTVLSETGQVMPNARVLAAGREAAVDVNGQFTFENLTLGTYTVTAISLADQFNGGRSTGVVDEPNEIAEVTVTLRGVAPVTVRVVASDGATAVATARVTLNAEGSFGTESPGPTAATLVGFTDGAGLVTFPSVPLGDYSARGEAGPLAGIAIGATPGVGQTSSVTVQLGASGAIAGRVLLPDGVTPAARTFVTLSFQSQTGLQSGVLQITTDLSGRFTFAGIPLGGFTVSAFEVVSNGVRSLSGSLATDGQTFDFGDVALDNTGPRVLNVSPADGSAGVAPTSPIVVTFSEPMLASSFSSNPVALMDGTTPVAGTLALSVDRRSVTFSPSQSLRSGAFYSVSVRGAPDGPRDESNIAMVDPFVSSFAVRDVIPPTIVSLSPAANAREVVPEAVVRVTFSEPVATAGIVLRNASGAIVPAQTTFGLGNTRLVLSPVDFLPANATFTATVSNVSDTAGNALAGGPVVFSFNTVDTLSPLITALGVQGVARTGATLVLTPTITGDDVARVEYLAGDVSSVATSGPFSTSVVVPVGVTALAVSARAVDQVGNRSAAFAMSIPVAENLAPTVQLINVGGQTVVGQGAALQFDVVGADDVGIAQVLLSAVGAATQSFSETIAGAPTSATRRFTVNVPVDATPGAGITVQAAVIDTAGNQSTPASVALTVRDGVAPGVLITAPATGTQAIPGQTIQVTVNATDSGGVTSMTLTCNPTLAGCETRPISPASTATTQTFNVQVPTSLNAPASITLLATAADATGNVGQAGRTVAIADVLNPTLAGLQPVSGSTRVLAGTTVAVRADALDNVAVAAVDFTAEGAATASGSAAVVPPVSPASVTFNIVVPSTAPNGGSITVRGRARDAAGNLSSEVTLVLTVGDTSPPVAAISQPDAGTAFTPGQSIGVQASGTDDVAVAQIVFRARGAVTFDETRTFSPGVTPAQATFTVPTTAATPAGTVTLTVQAVDTAGNLSADASRNVTIRDATGPAVAITSPAVGADIDPRVAFTVSVTATDAVGVAEIGLTTSGLLTSTTARAISPTQTSRTEEFTITFSELPVAGGQLTLTGSARDGAGNQALSSAVTVNVRDVVAPSVAAVTPLAGATGVATTTSIAVTFSEPMDRATLTAAAVRLSADTTPVATALVVAADDRSVTLTPSAPLSINTLYTVTVDATARDRAANPLAAPFVSTFRTVSPDSTSPKVVSIDPANGAVGVGTTTAVSVTFDEPVAPASITPTSFRVTISGTPVAGAFSFTNGGSTARFTPTTELPFDTVVVTELTGDITDLGNNRLVNADGSAIATPITFTFVTGAFAIVSPTGTRVLENSPVTLEARAASSLTVANVVFTVNGVAQPAVTAAPFTRVVTTPLAATTPTLTVVASARNASNVEIARAERTYDVVPSLRATPSVIGLDRGATGTVRFTLSEPASEDLAVALSVIDPAVVTLGSQNVVLAAGQTAIDVPVTACTTCPNDPPSRANAAVGNTSIVATSARGTAPATISVSDRSIGQALAPFAGGIGVGIALPASAGQILTTAGQQVTSVVTLLSEPATLDTPVTITSSNPAVASATGSTIGAGQLVSTLSITTGENGVAVLTIRAGDQVRSVTVFVGTPPPNQTPITLAPAVGAAIAQPLSAGQILTTADRDVSTLVTVLSSPAQATTTVSVTSSNPAVATATASAILAGQQSTTLSIDAVADGVTILTLRAGSEVRSVTVFVGPPPANQTPITLALTVGVAAAQLPSAGQVLAPSGQSFTVTVSVLDQPNGGTTPLAVSVTSSAPAVATAVASAVQPGQQVTTLTITTGSNGTAVLTLTAGTSVKGLTIIVGTPDPSQTPIVFALPVGVTSPGLPFVGQVAAPVGTSVTVGIVLLASPAPSDTTVNVTSSNPTIAQVVTSSVVIPAGSRVATVQLSTGLAGTATLTLESAGLLREFKLFVGAMPPPLQTPVTAAVPIGVSVVPSPNGGERVIAPAGSPVTATIGVQLLTTPAAGEVGVTITTSDPSLVSIGAGASVSTSISAGARVVPVTFATSGVTGAAILTFEFEGVQRQLLIVVGNPPASELPAVVAPVVGVQVP